MTSEISDIELEGTESAQSVLAHYDIEKDSWDLPEIGPFWDAVRQAHKQGRLGEGKRIAVIDGGCDFSIPRIRQQVGEGPCFSIAPGQPTAHGTVVALFIGRVAPKSKIDIYEITVDGKPDAAAVRQAINQAAQTDAIVINLSLGQPRDFNWSETEPCELCAAAIKARSNNKLVVTAVGNNAGAIYCPAQDEHCVAVGYRSEQRWVEHGLAGANELAAWAPPGYSQSWFNKRGVFTAQQAPGVAGSSFASPLLSGFSALLDNPLEVPEFVQCAAFAGEGAIWLRMKNREFADKAFVNGLNHLPHQHHSGETGAPCIACACFVHDLYVNAGLHYFLSNELDRAEELLRVAVWLNPFSADANANLGRTIEERALINLRSSGDTSHTLSLLDESVSLYDAAINIRPGFGVYEAERRKIQSLKQEITSSIN